jgi:DNA-binding transcriptional LysR family regulator
MELRLLRSFVAVAEERHFGRAAERLHMAQPPLSQQIRRLENELGVQLLHRTTRRVELAPAGEVLLARARAILEAVEQAAEDSRRAATGEVGRISIGFTGSTTYEMLPVVASALRQELPGVELELHGEMLTPAQVLGLVDGSLDVGLLRPPVRERSLTVEVIRSEPLIAALPAGHRLAAADAVPVEELADEPFVAYPSQFRSVLHDAVEEACAVHGFLPSVAIEAAETSTLVSFVAAGVGVSLVPASTTAMTVTGAVYRPLEGDAPQVQLAIASRAGDESAALRRALGFIHDAVRSIP